MKETLKKWTSGVVLFIKKYGIDGILSILIFHFPIYGMIFINTPEFIAFGAWWTTLWWGLGPLTPGWLIVILLAVFIRWLRLGIWAGIIWGKEAMQKLQLQNQLAAYLSAEEIQMILSMAKKVEGESESRRKAFKEKLRKERITMIDERWSEEVKREIVDTKDLL